MKRFKLFFRIPVFCTLIFLLVPAVAMCTRIRSDSIPLNFDRLFPEAPVQVVLENCMQIQNEFDLRSGMSAGMSEYEASLFVDVVVGRLFHVLSCMQDIVKKKTLVHPEDARYILSFVERLATVYDKKFQSIVPARGKHVVALFVDIKRVLGSLTG